MRLENVRYCRFAAVCPQQQSLLEFLRPLTQPNKQHDEKLNPFKKRAIRYVVWVNVKFVSVFATPGYRKHVVRLWVIRKYAQYFLRRKTLNAFLAYTIMPIRHLHTPQGRYLSEYFGREAFSYQRFSNVGRITFNPWTVRIFSSLTCIHLVCFRRILICCICCYAYKTNEIRNL